MPGKIKFNLPFSWFCWLGRRRIGIEVSKHEETLDASYRT